VSLAPAGAGTPRKSGDTRPLNPTLFRVTALKTNKFIQINPTEFGLAL
jgi:hypothetical protein